MHPQNTGCLRAAGIDCCVLANNHVLDWVSAGLRETLETLERPGSGPPAPAATSPMAAPAVIGLGSGSRALVFAFGSSTSGIPDAWAATPARPGVHLLGPPLRRPPSPGSPSRCGQRGGRATSPSPLSTGGRIGLTKCRREFRDFSLAHALIDQAGFDLVHGHSSHHPQGIEVHRNRLVIYGAGDFLNDYEGIEGHEEFRGDLTLLYLLALPPPPGSCSGCGWRRSRSGGSA